MTPIPTSATTTTGAPADVEMFLVRYPMHPQRRYGQHDHLYHQFCWSPTGTLIGEIGAQRWLIPTTHGLWIPAETIHDVYAAQPSDFLSAYFNPDNCPIDCAAASLVPMTPLLRAMLPHLADPALPPAERAPAEQVLYDNLHPVAAPPASIRLPADPVIAAIARALIDTPADTRSLDAWGRQFGACGRTITRRFNAETGLTFRDWRTRLRVHVALDLLAERQHVNAVARHLGYRDTTAFIKMFSRSTGMTPGDYRKIT